MIGLPVSTEFNKRIPKQKFYENIAAPLVMKKAFVEQIKIIYWRNKIATTTNLYFHKEVTYNRNWPKGMAKSTKYWITRKTHSYSDIVPYEKNPVKSTYEALWEEVRRAHENPAVAEQTSLQNTMRRILEHYFTFYGDISFQTLPMQLKTEDAFIARALLSWVNDGSHSSFDDFSYTPPMSDGIQRYLNIFALIFNSTGHKAHYNMMMKINEEETENGQTENA